MGDETYRGEGGIVLIDKAARLGIERARRWLEGARRAMEDDRWDDVVYSSQMAVEQSAKAVLLAIGVDFPKQHDVSDVFVRMADRDEVPSWFRDEVPRISDVVAKLSEQRGLASYGFEQGIGVGYFEDFAPEALREAEEVFSRCEDVLDQLLQA